MIVMDMTLCKKLGVENGIQKAKIKDMMQAINLIFREFYFSDKKRANFRIKGG